MFCTEQKEAAAKCFMTSDADMHALHEAGLAKSFYVYGENVCSGKTVM